MSEPPVLVEAHGHVLHVGVDRPAKRNAWNLDVIAGVADAYARLEADDDLRVGLLYGVGDHFSAGLDLAEVGPHVAEHGPGALAGAEEGIDPYGLWSDPVTKPVVLAVQGIAYTLSIELALAADIVVAADDVRFRQLEVGRGILPFDGATIRAPRQLGWGNAMRWLLTAEEFGAEEAHRIGLVQEVVAPGTQHERAAALADLVAAQAPLGVQGTLANARVARRDGDEAARAHLRGLVGDVLASDDAAEGLASFVERRDARFQGS